ncbi:FG-GAP-like repeat-containing protein [Methylorubrum thiocyanatum]
MITSNAAQVAALEIENPVVVAINAGGEALTQDGIDFLSDQFFTEGFTFGDIEGGNGLQPAFSNTVYQTERYGNFSYAIPVASTSQAYTVELRFGELWWSNPGERVFDVSLEGQTILDDLDILAQTGSFNTPYTYVSGPITAGANGTLDLQFLNGIDNAQISGIIVRQVMTVDVQEPGLLGDLDGDGRADLVLQNQDALGAWFMNAEDVLSGSNLPALGQGWAAVGIGDTSGDGRSDLLLQNGQTLATWLMNGDKVEGGGDIATLGEGWSVVGMADVDADGRADVLLQNDRAVAVWQLDGSKLVGGGDIATLVEGWQIAGTGDLNGDGRADLLLQNGQTLAAWQLDGSQITSGGVIETLGAGWDVAGMGDFDGNGRSDILLQNGQQLAIWQVNGTQFEGGGDVAVMADGWSVSGLADLNGDSKTDILLQNGQTLGTWTMNGTQIVSGATVNEQLASGWDLA